MDVLLNNIICSHLHVFVYFSMFIIYIHQYIDFDHHYFLHNYMTDEYYKLHRYLVQYFH